MNIKEKENVNHSVIKNSKGNPIMVVFKDKVTDEVTSIKHIQEKINTNPTESEVIDCLASLPFPCYFGKDRDGVLEITIPVK